MTNTSSLRSPGGLADSYRWEHQDQEPCCSDRTKALIREGSLVLLLLSMLIVGVCTGVGCINGKVGGGLILGMSAVVSCVEADFLKIMWKVGAFKEDCARYSLWRNRIFGGLTGFGIVGTITGVVVGGLLLSSGISPMVGGLLAATVASIPALSAILLGYICP